MKNIQKERQFYYHFKHDPKGPINNLAYELIGKSVHTETGEVFVNYRPLYTNQFLADKKVDFFSRPEKMFFEDVPDRGVPRFSKITDQKILEELSKL